MKNFISYRNYVLVFFFFSFNTEPFISRSNLPCVHYQKQKSRHQGFFRGITTFLNNSWALNVFSVILFSDFCWSRCILLCELDDCDFSCKTAKWWSRRVSKYILYRRVKNSEENVGSEFPLLYYDSIYPINLNNIVGQRIVGAAKISITLFNYTIPIQIYYNVFIFSFKLFFLLLFYFNLCEA